MTAKKTNWWNRPERLENFAKNNPEIINYLSDRQKNGFLTGEAYIILRNSVIDLIAQDQALDQEKFLRIAKNSHTDSFTDKIRKFIEKKSAQNNFTARRILEQTEILRQHYGQNLESYRCKDAILHDWFLVCLIYLLYKK
jgi:hypothetical protein